MMPVGVSELSCLGHIFEFDLTLFWAEFVLDVTSRCACTYLCFYLDRFGTAMRVWDVLHSTVVAYFQNGSHLVRP